LLHKRENRRSIGFNGPFVRANVEANMRLGTLVFAAALIAPAVVSAAPTAAQSQSQAQSPQGGRVIFVCDRSDAAWRTIERENGQVSFVTAEELARAQAAKETWSAPRCITAAELQRYETNASAPQLQRTRNFPE
jgi:hypothetical protein